MVAKREIQSTQIYQDFKDDQINFWFDFKKSKFLHNIDTFYYSVKFHNDFTSDTADPEVHRLRKFFSDRYDRMRDSKGYVDSMPLTFGDYTLNLRPFSFARFFTVCLQCPEWFDIFVAPVVPRGSDGGESVTSEIVVQIRSYMLWIYGVYEAFERSYAYVCALADFFGLQVAYAQENRVDYCWHSNYLQNPERFFAPDNFYKMRVDRYQDALIHTEKVGSQDYEIDYLSMGKRSEKVFIRIYLKSKEVVEKGYKGWFLKIWFFHGLINRYDLYVYEECYLHHNWRYMDKARLKFYAEYGSDPEHRRQCQRIIDGLDTPADDTLRKLADLLTPRVNLVVNVEYQTMRRHTKSYQLIPFKDNSAKETCQRIYDYLDNRRLIADYLTHYVFRLVTLDGDSNKSRREYCTFWEALRRCKMVDVPVAPKNVKLVRNYARKLNSQVMKTRAINAAVTYGIYTRGKNQDDVVQDLVETLCRLNDNDLHDALRFKERKIRQLNETELSDVYEDDTKHAYEVVNIETGEVS